MNISKKKRADEKVILKSKEIRKKVKKAESTLLKSYQIDSDHYILANFAKVLNKVYSSFRPVSADYEARKNLVKGLNSMAKEIYGNSESPVLEAYGSFLTDTFSRHSNLDVSITFGNDTSELSRYKKLETLGRFARKLRGLEGEGCIRKVESIFSAKVPIVKFFDKGAAAIECDLSVENKGGILNSQIIRIISQIDERFQKLCMLVKLWAKAQEVNSALQGTLNSVSITLLVALHLQRQNPPILPHFSLLFKDGLDPLKVEKITKKFINWGQRNRQSLGRLFATFFIRLQSVQYLWRQGLCASVLNGVYMHKKCGFGSIFVEDFVDISENVARRVSKEGAKKIYGSINRTLEDIFRFLNGEISEAYFNDRLFGQQAIVVPPLNGEIAGSYLQHSLVSQQVVADPPPVPSVDRNIARTHLRHRVFGQTSAIDQRPPPVPRFDEKLARTHLRHAATERPPSVPQFNGTHLRHGLFGQPATTERPPVLQFDGPHRRHGLFGEPAAVEHPPSVPRFNENDAEIHLRHGLFGQPSAIERRPPLPPLNVYPQQPHNNYRNQFKGPPEVHRNKRVCLENGYNAVVGMAQSREEERIYEFLRNKYAGNYNTSEEFRQVPQFGVRNNPSGDPHRQVPLIGGENGHLPHHRHDYSRRIGPPPPPPPPAPAPYGRVPNESFGRPNFHEPPPPPSSPPSPPPPPPPSPPSPPPPPPPSSPPPPPASPPAPPPRFRSPPYIRRPFYQYGKNQSPTIFLNMNN